MSGENIVYIGSKPVMNYCLAVLTSLRGDGSRVALKASTWPRSREPGSWKA